MAYGNLITAGTQVAVGTNGYVVSFDLLNQEPQTVFQVQAQKDGTVLSLPITTPISLSVLFGLPENDDPPDLAFAQNGTTVFVFFLSSAYVFDATTRVAFWFYRNAINLTTTSSKLDIPQEARELFKAMCLEKVYNLLVKPVPPDIQQTLIEEKDDLGLT